MEVSIELIIVRSFSFMVILLRVGVLPTWPSLAADEIERMVVVPSLESTVVGFVEPCADCNWILSTLA